MISDTGRARCGKRDSVVLDRQASIMVRFGPPGLTRSKPRVQGMVAHHHRTSESYSSNLNPNGIVDLYPS